MKTETETETAICAKLMRVSLDMAKTVQNDIIMQHDTRKCLDT